MLCLIMFASGWWIWAAKNRSDLTTAAMAPAVLTTATLVLFGAGIRAALAEYALGAENADVFASEGVLHPVPTRRQRGLLRLVGRSDRRRSPGLALLQRPPAADLVRRNDGGSPPPDPGGVRLVRGPQRRRRLWADLAHPGTLYLGLRGLPQAERWAEVITEPVWAPHAAESTWSPWHPSDMTTYRELRGHSGDSVGRNWSPKPQERPSCESMDGQKIALTSGFSASLSRQVSPSPALARPEPTWSR